jgi:hypothetical protein
MTEVENRRVTRQVTGTKERGSDFGTLVQAVKLIGRLLRAKEHKIFEKK